MFKRPAYVDIRLKNGESQEKLLRRFSKKCKKIEVVRQYLDKTTHFKTNRQKKKDKTERNKWLRNKYKFRRK